LSRVLGARWGRDHADDKKPVLAAALENAFDPATSSNCIGLHQAARDSAAAWLPPGMAFTGRDEADASGHTDSADHIDVDADDGDRDEAGASTDLPAFLTEDESAGAALNGASAP